jgi:hypothetical protein
MLRAQIAALQPRADAYDNIATLLRVAVPRQSQGAGEDLAWRLDRTIADMKKAMVKPASDLEKSTPEPKETDNA